MTKEQKIQEAFGESWNLLSHSMQQHILNVHHWVDRSRNRMNLSPKDLNFDESTECEVHCEFWRPIQLKGIENNNGWIKIENEKDFPTKDDSDYWIIKNGKVQMFHWAKGETLNSVVWLSIISHYQPIDQPKPPIY